MISEQEMMEYREKFFNLPINESVEEGVKIAIENGIPLQYFLQKGMITEDNYEGFSSIPEVKEHFNKLEIDKNYTEDSLNNYQEEYIRDNNKDMDNESELNINEEDRNKGEHELKNEIKIINITLKKIIEDNKCLRDDLNELKNIVDELLKSEIRVAGDKKVKARDKALLVCSYANKGGVGKTTVAVAMAEIFAEMGHKTLLIDLDYGGDNVATFFKISREETNYIKDINKIDKYIEKITANLYVLPSSKNISSKSVREKEMDKILSKVSDKFDIIVCDTCTTPYERPYMHTIVSKSDRIYAVVNQGIFSREETKAYAPKILFMGAKPENIRIILNQYEENMVDIDAVENDFNAGLSKVGRDKLPKVVVKIPNNWIENNKAMEEGVIINKDIWMQLYKDIEKLLS